MYSLAIIEPILSSQHGNLNNLKNKYIIVYNITINEFNNNEWNEFLLRRQCNNKKYNKIHIIKQYNVNMDDYTINLAILKTFWLNIFKRYWKKKHAQIMKRKSPKALFKRSIHGKLQ